MDTIIIAAAMVASLLALWWARGSSKQTSYLLFCQQRNDLILGLREARERLVAQAGHLSTLQALPLAPLDAVHVRSLWETVNEAVADLDGLREQAEGWSQQRPRNETVHAAFDRLHAITMQIARVHRDVEELEANAASRAPAPPETTANGVEQAEVVASA